MAPHFEPLFRMFSFKENFKYWFGRRFHHNNNNHKVQKEEVRNRMWQRWTKIKNMNKNAWKTPSTLEGWIQRCFCRVVAETINLRSTSWTISNLFQTIFYRFKQLPALWLHLQKSVETYFEDVFFKALPQGTSHKKTSWTSRIHKWTLKMSFGAVASARNIWTCWRWNWKNRGLFRVFFFFLMCLFSLTKILDVCFFPNA